MSLERIHLRKLLKLFYLPDNQRISALRADIRQELEENDDSESNGGGDFHSPFWADAKKHVAGIADLRDQTKVRIESNKGRQRLYPKLATGFLSWWDEKRRWRNERFTFIPNSVKDRVTISEVGGVVKVENLLALDVEGQFKRIIYPYFSETPTLSAEGGRLGLWLLHEALPRYQSDDLRVLDILRSKSFATIDHPFQGNERALFVRKYKQVVGEWTTLRKEYD